jgi:hypothetical protein
MPNLIVHVKIYLEDSIFKNELTVSDSYSIGNWKIPLDDIISECVAHTCRKYPHLDYVAFEVINYSMGAISG